MTERPENPENRMKEEPKSSGFYNLNSVYFTRMIVPNLLNYCNSFYPVRAINNYIMETSSLLFNWETIGRNREERFIEAARVRRLDQSRL